MYESFFGFRERPFDLTPNLHYLVLTEGHLKAISGIEYAIASRKGLTLLVGAAGLGKTTVIQAAVERQPPNVSCIHLKNPALTRPEFIEMLAVCFDLSDRARESKTVLLLELEALLRERHLANMTTVLIVDEAQTLPVSLLEEIRLLVNIETNDEKLLSVVLAGQPELALRLDDPAMSQLKQRIALSCELRPLTFKETAAYVLNRIEAAGGFAAQVFTIEAVALIHDAAKGIPRTINVIADNALLTGFTTAQRPVNRQIVREVCRDFRIPQQPGNFTAPAAGSGPFSPTAADPSAGDGLSAAEEEAAALLDASPSRTLGGPQLEPSLFARMSRRYFS